MPRIYKPTGPSVALRESQRSGDPGFIQAPNQTQQIDSLGRQSQAYLQAQQDQSNRNAQFQQTTLARAQQAKENNAQLSLQQMQARQNLDLRASGIKADQSLAADRLRMDQQGTANQISFEQSRIQTQQLTDFGQQFINFSQTLWQKKAEQINKENNDLRLQELDDRISGRTGNLTADLAKVNQVELMRIQGSLNAESAALELEKAGLKADATKVRAGNPFFLRGNEEGTAMLAGLGYPAYLRRKQREAIDSGLLNPLDPDHDAKLRQLLSIASKEYYKEQGLVGINPGVLTKYFGYQKVQAEAQILEEASGRAYKIVKEAQKETADSQVYNSASAILAMPKGLWASELQKLALDSSRAYSMNPLEGHASVLKRLIAHSDTVEKFDLVDAFMMTDRGGDDGTVFGQTPGLQEIYDKGRQLFTQRQAAQLEKLQDNQLDGIVAQFDKVFATGDVPSIREAQDSTVTRLMELGTPAAMAKARQIATSNPGESPMIQEQLRRAQDGGYLDRFLRENPDRMTSATREKWGKIAEQTSKLKEPAYKQAFDQALAAITFAAGEANSDQQKLLPPHSKQALNDFVKIQKNKLTQYAREWLAQNQGSNLKDFQDWLKTQEKSYTDPRQFIIDPQSNLPRGMQASGGGVEFTGNPQVIRVTLGGRMREDYRNPNVQQGLANGSISTKAIQPNEDLVLSKAQLKEAVDLWEKGGQTVGWIQKIVQNTPFSYKAFLQSQARVYGGSGVILDPGNYKLPPSPSGRGKVSFEAAQTFAQSSGISERGSVAFATMIQDESGGDGAVIGDSGDALGLMQWNKTGSPERVRRLQQFAAQRGKPVTDPGVQLNYAIYEMKNHYPSVWSVLSSRNPTNNQLWRASVEYLGFSPRVYAQRKASLERNLQ